MNPRWLLPFALLVAACSPPSTDGSESSAEREDPGSEVGMYQMYSDTDTLMLERYVRTDTTVVGLMLVGRMLMQGYHMGLGDEASVTSLDLRLRPYPQFPDSAQMYVYSSRRGRMVHVLHRDPGQRMNSSYELDERVQLGVSGSVAFLEQLVRHARALGGDSVEIPIYLPGTRKNWKAMVSILPRDSVRVMLSSEEWRFLIDDEGRLLGGETVGSKVKMRRLEVGE